MSREDMCTQLTARGNHIQFFYTGGKKVSRQQVSEPASCRSDHFHWWNYQARQLWGVKMCEQHSQQKEKVRHKIINLTKSVPKAMSSAWKKQQSCSNSLNSLNLGQLPKRGAWGITAFRFHQFIKFVYTWALKHNSGINFLMAHCLPLIGQC